MHVPTKFGDLEKNKPLIQDPSYLYFNFEKSQQAQVARRDNHVKKWPLSSASFGQFGIIFL